MWGARTAAFARRGAHAARNTSERAGAATGKRFTPTQSLTLTIAPRPNSAHMFEARIDGRLLCTSPAPFCEAARVLLAEGADPATVIAMRHVGSDTIALRTSLGHAAGLTVADDGKGRPRFRKWQPSPFHLSANRLRLEAA
jgi:hypothetical protein